MSDVSKAGERQSSAVAMTVSERRSISVIASVAMLRMIGLFALLPVVALYAAGFDDATPLLVGMAVGAYGLTQAGLQIPLGALSDRVGRIPVLVGGLLVFALGSAIAAYADSIQMLIVGRLLQGAGAISSTLVALVADSTRVEIRTRAMAIYGVGFGLSFIIAVVFGPWFAARYGVPSLFGLAVAMALLAIAMLFALPGDIEKPQTVRSWNFASAWRPGLIRLDGCIFVLHAILTATFVGLPFLLTSTLEVPQESQWTFYVLAIVVSLLGTVPLILWDERGGRARSLAVAVALILAGEAILAFAGFAFAPVVLALALFFAGFNFLEASLPSRVSALADSDSRGVSLGVFATSQFLGIFAGGLLGGRLLDAGNPDRVFLACAAVAAIWLAAEFAGDAARGRGGREA